MGYEGSVQSTGAVIVYGERGDNRWERVFSLLIYIAILEENILQKHRAVDWLLIKFCVRVGRISDR
jgi:hypothetical protein